MARGVCARPRQAVVTEAEAIAAAQIGVLRDLPQFRGATVTGAGLDRYANAIDTFAFRTEPEPDPDQPVWVVELSAPGSDETATVVVDATDGRVVFWATSSR
jgi:hypothetical protein